MRVLSRSDILRCVPHGDEALLLSNAVVDGQAATSELQLEGSERCFSGHYPGHPVLPAATLLEMFGQLGAVLMAALGRDRKRALLARVNNFRVLEPTVPPALLRIAVELEAARDNVVFLRAHAGLGAQQVATASLTVAEPRS